MIAVLSGGVGAARFLEGAKEAFEGEEIVAIVNVGDDEIMHGLHISPDVDTILYTLAGLVNPATGWGLANESWRVMERLASLGGQTWFRLGDLDLATHLYRSERILKGASLTDTTRELCGKLGAGIKVLPVSNDPMRTRVTVTTADGGSETIGFQEYFVERQHDCDVTEVSYQSAGSAHMTAEVSQALALARAIVIAPSNPILSIAPMLSIDALASLLIGRRERVLAISPIVAGSAIKGPAGRLLDSLGFESSALGVAKFYRDYVGHIVVDDLDAGLVPEISALGISVSHCNTVMDSPEAKRALGAFVKQRIDG